VAPSSAGRASRSADAQHGSDGVGDAVRCDDRHSSPVCDAPSGDGHLFVAQSAARIRTSARLEHLKLRTPPGKVGVRGVEIPERVLEEGVRYPFKPRDAGLQFGKVAALRGERRGMARVCCRCSNAKLQARGRKTPQRERPEVHIWVRRAIAEKDERC